MKRNLDVLIMAGILIVLIAWTITRNEVWTSESLLWYSVTQRSPNMARGYANLAGALITEKQYQKARDWGLRGLKVSGEKPYYLYFNIGNAYHRLGNLPDAYKYARKAVELNQTTKFYNKITKQVEFMDTIGSLQQLGLILRDMGWKVGMPSPPTLEE